MRSYLPVRTREITTKVPFELIDYIQRERRKLNVYTGNQVLSYYENMENVARELDQRFFRMLKGCYVNMERLKEVKDQCAFFEGGNRLYISRESQAKLRHAHYCYMKNNSCL